MKKTINMRMRATKRAPQPRSCRNKCGWVTSSMRGKLCDCKRQDPFANEDAAPLADLLAEREREELTVVVEEVAQSWMSDDFRC
jgi:hypothetical protein